MQIPIMLARRLDAAYNDLRSGALPLPETVEAVAMAAAWFAEYIGEVDAIGRREPIDVPARELEP